MDAVIPILALKVATTASVIVAASVAGERFGPFWGALIACLPVSAGPAYVLLALDHDAAFIAGSALNSCIGIAATWVYLVVFVRLGGRYGLIATFTGALAAWFATAGMIRSVSWSISGALICDGLVLALAVRLTPRPALTTPSVRPLARPWLELPVRALLVGGFVVLVATVSGIIGSSATGLAAVFPVAMSSLALVMARRFGMPGATAALAASVQPMGGIAAAFAVLSATATRLGEWPALALALVVSMAWPGALVVIRRLRPPAG